MHDTRSRTALKHTSRNNILPHPFPIWLVAARVQPLLPNPGLHGRSARLFSSLPAILCEKKKKERKNKNQHKRESRWIKQPRCRGNYSGAKSPLKSYGGCMASVTFIGAELFHGICTERRTVCCRNTEHGIDARESPG